MDFNLQQTFEEITIFLKKFAGVLLLLLGATGATTRMAIDKNIAHTSGQKFVIVFSGSIFSYLIGGLARSANFSHELISLVGFMCGMFGYSIMRYIIDNEQVLFHNTSNIIARICDVILSSIATKVKTWFNIKEDKTNEDVESK